MSREIKFRAWDEYNGLFLDSSKFNVRLNGVGVQLNDTAGMVGGIIVEQYAVKDKNDVDLFDGDIFKDDECDNMGYIIKFDDEFPICYCENIKTKTSDYDLTDIPRHGIKIGNIHQNPELLSPNG